MHKGLILVAALVAACGGSSTPGTSSCTITFSGGVTGSGNCTAVGGNGYKSGSSGSGVGIGLSGTVAGVSSFAFALDLGSTNVTAGTYSNTATTASAGTALTTPGNQAWVQSSHASGSPDVGTYTLTISSLGTGISANNGTAYANMTGTLTATLPAITATGATGTVTVNVTF